MPAFPALEPLRILVAPSGFKESLGVEAVTEAISAGVRRVVPDALVHPAPLVDGGEGSAATLARASGGWVVPVRVEGPVGAPVNAHFAVLGGHGPRTALVEMAAAAGLRLVPPDARDPGRTSTYGVGQLVRAALDQGCRRVIVGCGDSGTCDGGAGMLQALGADVLAASGARIGRGGYEVARAATVRTGDLDPRLAGSEIVLACNPCNVLTGPKGVATVFGPQKGADADQARRLDTAMEQWAAVLTAHSGVDPRSVPGGGASGGLGAGAAGVLGARLVPRFDVLLDHVDLDARIEWADLVITAEGAIDAQTPHGKIPGEVARRAKRSGTPVLALAGTIGGDAARSHSVGIDAIAGIIAAPVDLAGAMRDAYRLTTDAAERALRLVLVGTVLGARRPARRGLDVACATGVA